MEERITMREAKKNIRDLNDNLETYLQLKKINYEKTQPKAMKINDIIVQQSHVNVDRFCNYMIKDSDLDLKITAMLESINAYEALIIKRIKSIALANKNEALIISLREDEEYASKHDGKPMEWFKISQVSGYSEKQCRRIYQNYLNN